MTNLTEGPIGPALRKLAVPMGFGIVFLMGVDLVDTFYVAALGAGDELLPLLRSYMTLWFAGVVFLVVPIVGNGALRAAGDDSK